MDTAAVLLALTVLCVGADAEDLPIAGFEGDDYGDRTVEGEAFGPGPARGALPGQMQVTGYEGGGRSTASTASTAPQGS